MLLPADIAPFCEIAKVISRLSGAMSSAFVLGVMLSARGESSAIVHLIALLHFPVSFVVLTEIYTIPALPCGIKFEVISKDTVPFAGISHVPPRKTDSVDPPRDSRDVVVTKFWHVPKNPLKLAIAGAEPGIQRAMGEQLV
jgi:hypothetical protein